jgi:hypothetical protein
MKSSDIILVVGIIGAAFFLSGGNPLNPYAYASTLRGWAN